MPLPGKSWDYKSPAIDLVMSRVNRGTIHECWISQSPVRGKRNPYPVVKVGGSAGRVEYCHIIVFEHHYGYRPSHGEIMHLCNNKRCVNPYHLAAGTQSENARHAAATKKGLSMENYTPCRQTLAKNKQSPTETEAAPPTGILQKVESPSSNNASKLVGSPELVPQP